MRSLLLFAGFSLVAPFAFGQTYTVRTFAGGGIFDVVPAVSVGLGYLDGMATDKAGNLYVAWPTQSVILKLDAVNGTLTRVAGTGTRGFSGDGGQATSAELYYPHGIAVDAAGNLFIADTFNFRIREVSNGIITTVAGTGIDGFAGDGGAATSAKFGYISHIAVDAAGNLFLTDTNRVRKISGGVVTTVAGNGTAGFSGDGGLAVGAQLNTPSTLAVDANANLYIADSGNNRVRKVSSGVITTFAGTGNLNAYGDGGLAVNAGISSPSAVAVDATGNVYISDIFDKVIREVANGTITTFTKTRADSMALDGAGNLYMFDGVNNWVSKLSHGVTTLAAGNGTYGSNIDNVPAGSAWFATLWGLATDPLGTVYFVDLDDARVGKIANGTVTLLAGTGIAGFSGDGGPGRQAQLSHPRGVGVDSAGNVYIADDWNQRIRKLAGGVISTVAGRTIALTDTSPDLGDNGPATSAKLEGALSVVADQAGNLYISDWIDNRIRKVSNGIITTIAGNGTAGFSGDNGPAVNAELNYPDGLALDSAGNLYIADYLNNRVRKVSNGIITTVAGTGAFAHTGDNGLATAAALAGPETVAVDSAGNLYILEIDANTVRKISNGIIVRIAGTGALSGGGDGGPATAAAFYYPSGLAVDAAGNVYVADQGNNRIRILTPDAACSYSVTPPLVGVGAAGGSLHLAIQTGSGCTWSISNLPSWISVTGQSAGVGPAAVTLAVSPDTGAARSSVFSVAGASVTVTQSAAGSVSLTAYQNAASYLGGPIAPGEILLLYGNGLGPSQLVSFSVDSSGIAPTQVAGTQVFFDGIPAPVIYTSATQVCVVAPYSVKSATTIITAVYQGLQSNLLTAPAALVSPAIFTAAGGAGQAAALNQDGSFNTLARPAPIGSIITLFATGEGQTSPAGVDGKVASTPLPMPIQAVTATIDGLAANVVYAGGAPGEVAGVMQLNLQIPAGVRPSGTVPLVVTIGSTPVQAGVTVAVSAQ